MHPLNSIVFTAFAAVLVAGTPAPQTSGSPSLIRFFTTSTNPAVDHTYISSNGTHLGIRGGGPPSSAVQASTSPGSKANTNILTVAGDGNALALAGPDGNLAFVEVPKPPPPPAAGIVLEWDWWRLFPAPDPRVRMADMTASVWIATQDSTGSWLLTWFKGNTDPSMTTVTVFWEPVPV